MKRTPHAVRGAYAHADSTMPCPNCKAEPYVWCNTSDGRVRWIPCVARLQPPLDAVTVEEHPDIDPSQVQLPRGNARPLYEQIHDATETQPNEGQTPQ
jgi:hypothetical protein